MRRALTWVGAGLLVSILLILVLRPWTWLLCLPAIPEPLPPSDQLRQPPLQPGTFPGELIQLVGSVQVPPLPESQSIDSLPPERRSHVKAVASSIDQKLEAILDTPPGRWSHTGQVPGSLDSLAELRQIARLLDIDGRLAVAEGNRSRCRRDGILLIRIGRRLTERADAVTFLLGIALQNTGCRLLLLYMDGPEVTVEELGDLCRELKGLKEQIATWDELLRWEYAGTYDLLLRAPGLSRLHALLLNYLGVIGPCPLSVARVVYRDAQNWDELPPEKLWLEPWKLSGPNVPPRVPGVSITRADLDKRVNRNVIVRMLIPSFQHMLDAHSRGQLYPRIVFATAAAQAHRVASGRWPRTLSEAHLARLGLTVDDVRDPFSREPLLWFPHKRALLSRARQLAKQRSYLSKGRPANLRKLLEDAPVSSPIVWVPLGSRGEATDEFGVTLFLVDRTGIDWVERRQAAQLEVEAEEETRPKPPVEQGSPQQDAAEKRARKEPTVEPSPERRD